MFSQEFEGLRVPAFSAAPLHSSEFIKLVIGVHLSNNGRLAPAVGKYLITGVNVFIKNW